MLVTQTNTMGTSTSVLRLAVPVIFTQRTHLLQSDSYIIGLLREQALACA